MNSVMMLSSLIITSRLRCLKGNPYSVDPRPRPGRGEASKRQFKAEAALLPPESASGPDFCLDTYISVSIDDLQTVFPISRLISLDNDT